MVNNPVGGFSISKDNSYRGECARYQRLMKKILNTELKIVGYPSRNGLLHEPLSNRCKGLLHARVDQNMRILYLPDYKNKIVFLKRLLPHREMEKMCN